MAAITEKAGVLGNESNRQNPQIQAPAINLPKGGGAIRGIGEKFAANPVTGTGSMSVPIATSQGRSGFGPQLSLTYDSGAGNGPFGFGWSFSLPSITRKTDKGLPQYLDTDDSDVFILSGAEDLVPVYRQDMDGTWIAKHHKEHPDYHRDPESFWVLDKTNQFIVHEDEIHGYLVRRYRPRIEGLFARIERWTNKSDSSDVFWRSISKDNITTWYGKTADSRIVDPTDKSKSRIFSWLICQSHDDKGNVIVYGYKQENSQRICEDPAGKTPGRPHERNRTDESRSAQRYLKYIRYGNRTPYFPEMKDDGPWPEPPDAEAEDGSNSWCFEVVFDYGEHDASAPKPNDKGMWPLRNDPFSSYRACFEIRTYRICKRVLMFHHFPGTEDDGVGINCLVRSTDFTYSKELSPSDAGKPVYTFLHAVTQAGYRRNNGGYVQRCLPPVEFIYSEPTVQGAVEEVDPKSLENLPIGLDGSIYRWVALHGEGVPGILTEQAGTLLYKRNLSPIPEKQPDGRERVKAQFAPLETVALKPNVSLVAGAEIMDLAGDGQPDVVVMDGPAQGFYEHDEAEGWQPFRPFLSRLNRDFRDPNLRLVDLDDDGHADALITEGDVFIWHASLAEEGFGPARRVAQALDEEQGPRIVFADGTQSIYLADLSGDGLTDIVRIRNGEVCYWPNLGYCRFGAKVTMDNSPWFDNPDQFDHKRIRLADIDGSGTTDIIYLHRDGVRLYFNQSGNGWSKQQVLPVFPRIDDLVSIVPIDLLGNGTACLVWSSPLPGDARRQMLYVNLMGGKPQEQSKPRERKTQKPHLLVSVRNNLGAETRIDYAPSTQFYLQDKRDGKPWITRLPFPVHVVERVETIDHISRNRFVTRYAYHHGYFDGEEREFRGFGMVEQWDTEEFAALANGKAPADNIAAASHVPPVHIKTWFHTGTYLGRDHISDYFAGLLNATDQGEYFREPGFTDAEARALLLSDSMLPAGLALEEEREACRALKGSMLRQEVYADDAGPSPTPEHIERIRTPYTVTEQNFTIRTLQARGDNRHAVFFTHACEVISYHYERNPTDPRVQHALTLEVDAFGNVLKQVAIGYGRRRQTHVVDAQGKVQLVPNPGLAELDVTDQAKQTTPLLTYTENQVTKDHDTGRDAIDRDDDYRVPLPCETLTFELTGYTASGPVIGPATIPAERIHRYQSSDFVEPDPASPGRLRHKFTAPELTYETTATGNLRRRPIESLRTLYRADNLESLLPFGDMQPLALPGESYKLAFTRGLLDQVFKRPRQGQLDEFLLPTAVRAVLLGGQAGDQGGYVDLDGNGHWWIPSGRVWYHPDQVPANVELAEARAHFFQPRRYTDPFGYGSTVTYEYDLLMKVTQDALGNTVQAINDYRVLQAAILSDPNGNQTCAAFDALGLVVATAVSGKNGEGDIIDDFIQDPTQELANPLLPTLQEFIKDPRGKAANLLKRATTRIMYDLDRYCRCGQPPLAATLARETHVSEVGKGAESKIQISFLHSDGFGREIQKKIQAEGGESPVRKPETEDADGGDIKPGPLVIENGKPKREATLQRWVGKGRTVYNNKGKPIKQYEPFFSSTHLYEGEPEMTDTGVTPILFYDPAERVIAMLHPNHTYEKVVFDPWRQTTYDVNDTCARPAQKPGELAPRETGDPRTDPDIGGYVAEYFKALPVNPAQPWQTWRAQRIGGALGTDEQNVAQQAATHADTPTTTHFDALGRPFLTVARNRVMCKDHPLDGRPDEEFRTRVELDIEGNQRAVLDERKPSDGENLPLGDLEQRIVMRYDYDMLGNRIHQHSMEAGERWMLNDVLGKPIRAWDSRGHELRTEYDALRRPIAQFVRGHNYQPGPTASDPRTLSKELRFGRTEYGEGQPDDLKLNLRGRVFKVFDGAGVVTHETYDFKGNLRESARTLANGPGDHKRILDWNTDTVQGGWEDFKTKTSYDALNRPVTLVTPDQSVIRPGYNEANLLETMAVNLRGAAAVTDFVTNIDYDAKGQRKLIRYGNGVTTRYEYDPQTFRLIQLTTTRPAELNGLANALFKDAATVQDLHYTYDPAGNITRIGDDALPVINYGNQSVAPQGLFTYDALYRLVEAVGRESIGQTTLQLDLPQATYRDYPFAGLGAQPFDPKAVRTYTERYMYDAVGNFLNFIHKTGNGGWTRDYHYNVDSYIEPGKYSNALSGTVVHPNAKQPINEDYHHDAHGNMTEMPHLSSMQSDFLDRLAVTARQVVHPDPDLPDKVPETTYYVYDGAGQRVRKVTERQNGKLKDERIYLGGFEVWREYNGLGINVTLKRETLHVMDDKQRIALVETQTDVPVPDAVIRYQLGNHLGSASLELDEAGQLISYEEYHPYGTTAYKAGRSIAEISFKRYRYTGKERDEESGFYYYGARYYVAWLGRWVSTDRLGLVDGSNLYFYVKNNGMRFIDVEGHAAGNPGTVIGTEVHDGIVYKRFQAVKGTWVSASLKQLGYDTTYGKETAYGAYEGAAKGLDMKPLRKPDKISPGQQYIIPIGREISFAPQEVIGRQIPTAELTKEVWQEGAAKRSWKDPGPLSEALPYGTFELRGPKPLTTDRRDAVRFWLSQHKEEIAAAERKWGVSRLAISGVIAWEAINNPTGHTKNALNNAFGVPAQKLLGYIHFPYGNRNAAPSFGIGKMHGDPESWAGAVGQLLYGSSDAGVRMLRARGNDSAFMINFIGAAMSIAAQNADASGFNIRNEEGILGQAYHGNSPKEWKEKMAAKKPGDSFYLNRGTMGEWIPQNRAYLESAVGIPEYH